MNQRKRDPAKPTGEQSNVERGSIRHDARGEPDRPDQAPRSGRGDEPRPDRQDDRKDSHPGYAEMDSDQRDRWDEASAEIHPEEAVWGTNQERDHVDDDKAGDRQEGTESERGPAAALKSKTRGA